MRAYVWLGAPLLAVGLFVAAWPTPRAPLRTPPRVDGLWIWTRTDAALLATSREKQPRLAPGVLVASVSVRRGGALALRRGLSPVAAGRSVALVVRLEDSVHARIGAPHALARDLEPQLGEVMAEARATGARISEVQLDYDAPVRRLAEWAAVVRELRRGALSGVPVWVTSIPAHLAQRDYGDMFRGVADGHILQLFDTGLGCSPAQASRIEKELARAHMPYRLGFATYERMRGGRVTTQHACWRRGGAELERAPGFAGNWLFPAGRDTRAALADLEATQ